MCLPYFVGSVDRTRRQVIIPNQPPHTLPTTNTTDTKVHWTMLQGSGPVLGQDYRGACRFGGQLPVGNNGSQLMSNYDTPDFYGWVNA